MKRKSLYLLTLAVLFCTLSVNRVFSQNIPARPVPPRLVNDFAGMLKTEEISDLGTETCCFQRLNINADCYRYCSFAGWI